jgi:hypothetical protein
MRRTIVLVIVAVLALAGVFVYRNGDTPTASNGATGGGGRGGPGGRSGVARPPMPVEFATSHARRSPNRSWLSGI